MQPYSLIMTKFIEHAAKWHPNAEVVSAGDAGVARATYQELCNRSGRLSAAFQTFGITLGDCIATLAWNTQAHMECWYASIGIGAVCHTLNPRLTV
jgi:3-(methylthio)propionyl---CoA ligase